MQFKFVMLVLSMTFCAVPYTHSAQLQAQAPIKKEASIIKNVAASLKNEEHENELTKQTSLDQLIKNADQTKTHKASSEESRALASLNNKQFGVVPRNKLTNFLQSLFGG